MSDPFESTAVEPYADPYPPAAPPAHPHTRDLVFSTFPSVESMTRAQRVALYNAMSAEGESLEEHCGETLQMINAVGVAVRMTSDKTGEVRDCVRSVIITTDGQYYTAVSEGIIRALDRIALYVEQPPWSEPIAVIPRLRKTRQGYRVLTLELAEDAEPEPAPERKKK